MRRECPWDRRMVSPVFESAPPLVQRERSAPLHRNRAQWVGAAVGHETDTSAQHRQVVGENCGRTAQSEFEVRGQNFAIQGNGFIEAIEDEIEIDLACDRDVELGHRCPAKVISGFRIITIDF
jgi:hypothetical protein